MDHFNKQKFAFDKYILQHANSLIYKLKRPKTDQINQRITNDHSAEIFTVQKLRKLMQYTRQHSFTHHNELEEKSFPYDITQHNHSTHTSHHIEVKFTHANNTKIFITPKQLCHCKFLWIITNTTIHAYDLDTPAHPFDQTKQYINKIPT